MRLFSTTILISILAISAIANDGSQEFTRIELENTKPINFADYGGPHIELYITSADTALVTIMTIDFTQTIPVAKTRVDSVEYNAFTNTTTVKGSNWVDTKYPKNIRQVEKRNGIPFQASNHNMYLLFQEPATGVNLYYLDDISRINYNDIVIQKPHRLTTTTLTPSTTPITEHEKTPLPKKQSEGAPLSPELFSWYVKLVKERESLSTSNSEAVAQFNKHVAAYNKELNAARQRMTPQ